MAVDVGELADFLVRAKRRTYAAGGDASSVTPTIPGSKQLEFEFGPLLYRDIYFGNRLFAGQETVYRAEQPVWTMVYSGYVLGSPGDESVTRIYGFLIKALGRVTPDSPFRGPDIHEEGEFRYLNKANGSINTFCGSEHIEIEGRDVYRLRYSGGLLS